MIKNHKQMRREKNATTMRIHKLQLKQPYTHIQEKNHISVSN